MVAKQNRKAFRLSYALILISILSIVGGLIYLKYNYNDLKAKILLDNKSKLANKLIGNIIPILLANDYESDELIKHLNNALSSYVIGLELLDNLDKIVVKKGRVGEADLSEYKLVVDGKNLGKLKLFFYQDIRLIDFISKYAVEAFIILVIWVFAIYIIVLFERLINRNLVLDEEEQEEYDVYNGNNFKNNVSNDTDFENHLLSNIGNTTNFNKLYSNYSYAYGYISDDRNFEDIKDFIQQSNQDNYYSSLGGRKDKRVKSHYLNKQFEIHYSDNTNLKLNNVKNVDEVKIAEQKEKSNNSIDSLDILSDEYKLSDEVNKQEKDNRNIPPIKQRILAMYSSYYTIDQLKLRRLPLEHWQKDDSVLLNTSLESSSSYYSKHHNCCMLFLNIEQVLNDKIQIFIDGYIEYIKQVAVLLDSAFTIVGKNSIQIIVYDNIPWINYRERAIIFQNIAFKIYKKIENYCNKNNYDMFKLHLPLVNALNTELQVAYTIANSMSKNYYPIITRDIFEDKFFLENKMLFVQESSILVGQEHVIILNLQEEWETVTSFYADSIYNGSSNKAIIDWFKEKDS